MSIIVIILVVFILWISAQSRKPANTDIEVIKPTKVVEIEIIDEMTKEKVRNLYEEQDLYNAKISYLMRMNKQYEQEMLLLDERLQRNLDDIRTQAMMQSNVDMRVLKASYESSNQNILKHKMKLEGMMLSNSEKIISYKKKSNAISEKITKIGKEIYDSRIQVRG